MTRLVNTPMNVLVNVEVTGMHLPTAMTVTISVFAKYVHILTHYEYCHKAINSVFIIIIIYILNVQSFNF